MLISRFMTSSWNDLGGHMSCPPKPAGDGKPCWPTARLPARHPRPSWLPERLDVREKMCFKSFKTIFPTSNIFQSNTNSCCFATCLCQILPFQRDGHHFQVSAMLSCSLLAACGSSSLEARCHCSEACCKAAWLLGLCYIELFSGRKTHFFGANLGPNWWVKMLFKKIVRQSVHVSAGIEENHQSMLMMRLLKRKRWTNKKLQLRGDACYLFPAPSHFPEQRNEWQSSRMASAVSPASPWLLWKPVTLSSHSWTIHYFWLGNGCVSVSYP